jgi:hypothetical protein
MTGSYNYLLVAQSGADVEATLLQLSLHENLNRFLERNCTPEQ